MCWSSEASLTFFIIGWALCLGLIIRNGKYDRLFGIFFMWIIFMQFLEYLIWLDQKCDKGINNVACQMAWFQNLMQPLVGGILTIIYIYGAKKGKKPIIPLPIFISLLVAYLIAFLTWIFVEKPYKDKLCSKPCKGCKHNLQWPWGNNYNGSIWIAYALALAIVLIAAMRNRAGLVLGVYLVVTCIISACFIPITKSLGSWWCVFAVGGPLVKLLIPLSFFKNS